MAAVQLAPGIQVQDFVAEAFLQMLQSNPQQLAVLANQVQNGAQSVEIAPGMPVSGSTLNALAEFHAPQVQESLQQFQASGGGPGQKVDPFIVGGTGKQMTPVVLPAQDQSVLTPELRDRLRQLAAQGITTPQQAAEAGLLNNDVALLDALARGEFGQDVRDQFLGGGTGQGQQTGLPPDAQARLDELIAQGITTPQQAAAAGLLNRDVAILDEAQRTGLIGGTGQSPGGPGTERIDISDFLIQEQPPLGTIEEERARYLEQQAFRSNIRGMTPQEQEADFQAYLADRQVTAGMTGEQYAAYVRDKKAQGGGQGATQGQVAQQPIDPNALVNNPTADAISLPVLMAEEYAPKQITAADILALQNALATDIKATSGALVDETLADALSSIRKRHTRPGVDSALIGAETGVARRAALEKAQQAAQLDLAAQRAATDIAVQNQGTQGGVFSQLLSGGLQGQQLLAEAGESEIERQFKEDLVRLEQEQQIRLQQMRDAAAQSQINQASRGQMVGNVVGAIAPAIFNQGRNPFEEYTNLAKKYPQFFPSFDTNQSGVRNASGMGFQMQTNDNQLGNFGGGSTMLDPFKPKFGAGMGL